MPRHRRVSMFTALAMVATLAFATPANASTFAFHASGPFGVAIWSYEDGDLTVDTRVLAFRQNGSQGPSIVVVQQIWNGEELVSDTSGSARGHVYVKPYLNSISIDPTVVTVQTCTDDYTSCGDPWDLDLGAITWTGIGEATKQPDGGPATSPPPPPFCMTHMNVWFRDATLTSAADPFGGAFGEIGVLQQPFIGDVSILYVSVGGGCDLG